MRLRFLALTFMLVACGDTRSEQKDPNTPTPEDMSGEVTVFAKEGTWMAFRTDANGWTTLPSNGAVGASFKTDASGRYGLAVRDDNGVYVIQATHAELNEVHVGEEPKQPVFRLSGQILGAADPRMVSVQTSAGASRANTSGVFALDVPQGTTDLAAFEYSREGSIEKMALLRDLSVEGHVSNIQINLASNFIVPRPQVLDCADCRWASSSLWTSSGRFQLSELDDTSDGTLNWFSPGSGLLEKDLFRFTSQNDDREIERVVAATLEPQRQDLALSAVRPLTGVTISGGEAISLTGLEYTPGSESPPLLGYTALLSQTGNDNLAVMMTRGWLNGETGYEIDLPDAIQGTSPVWTAHASVLAQWQITAIMSTRNWNEIMYLHPNAPFEEHLATQQGAFLPRDASSTPDASVNDSGADDAGLDGGSDAGDGGRDAGSDAGDGGRDAGSDAGDGGRDAGSDGGPSDAGDGGRDAGSDGGPSDAGDGGRDAGHDGGPSDGGPRD